MALAEQSRKTGYLDVRGALSKAGLSKVKYGESYDASDLIRKGVRAFKRRTLGLCGIEKTLELEEVEKILLDIKAVDSREEARSLVPKMYWQIFEYNSAEAINFTEIKSPSKVSMRVMLIPYPTCSGK